MTKRRKIVVGLAILASYALTGIHGPIVYGRQLRLDAEEHYAGHRAREQSQAEMYEEVEIEAPESNLHPDGPKTGVNWAIPVLPFVFVAVSYEVMGPLWGHGGTVFVIYLGFWTIEVPTPFGWIS